MADDQLPEIDVKGCQDPRVARALRVIAQTLRQGNAYNANNLGGYPPAMYLDLSYSTGQLPLERLDPQPVLPVQLTGDMAKVDGEYQCSIQQLVYDGVSSYLTVDPEFTVFDTFRLHPMAQTGDRGYITYDVERQVWQVARLNSPTWFIVTLASDLAQGATQDVTLSRPGYDDKTWTVRCPYLAVGTKIPAGAKCRIEWDWDNEQVVVTIPYACPQ